MDAVRLRGGWLLRHHMVATVAFALVAGVVGGLAISAWTSARRSAGALPSFLEVADLPRLSLTFCPPDLVDPTVDDLRERCFAYDAVDEVAQLRGLPTVRQAARVSARAAVLAGSVAVNDKPVIVNMMHDPGLESVSGRPIVLAGRLADDDADDEAVINELFRDRYGVDVGDHVQLRFLTAADLGTPGADPTIPRPTVELDVVGLIRTEDDLNAQVSGAAKEMIQTPPGVERLAGGAGTLYSAILVRTSDDAASHASIESAFPGRTFNNGFNFAADDFAPLDDAYRYEARAAVAFAVVTALAGFVFVGQALSRQVRREWSDLPALRALGLSSRQVAESCVVRAAPIALGATAVAVLVAGALSPFLPVGTARAGVLDRGVRLDGVVLAIALPLLVGLVMLVAWFPVWRSERSRAGVSHEHRVPLGAGWSPPASVGVGLALNGSARGTGLPVGAAVVGVALGALALVASVGLVASLDRLIDTPRLYGAAWDLSTGGLVDSLQNEVTAEIVALEGVERAGALRGTDLLLDDEVTWVEGIEPLPGDKPAPELTITRGREPIRPLELAVGRLTLEQLGLDLGDEVTVSTTVTGGPQEQFTIVGEVVVNSTDEGSPGFGALAVVDTLERFDPTAKADIVVVDLADGPAGDEARAALERRAADSGGRFSLSGPVRQPAVGNVVRLRSLPYVLAALVAVLAAGSLAHALVVSLRRNRHQLAVLKAIGFTRPQVSTVVAWQATTLAGIALLFGIPLGVLVARWGWRVIADQLGVAGGPVLPPLALLVVALAVLAFANLAALWPGWRAARVPAAVALRTE